jgi:biotin carboxylase
MPFLEGIPCSIHGWVFPDEVIGFRPCEMLVLRVPGASTLSYAGAGTAWEPSGEVTRAMQEAVVRVGQHLREKVGYLGSFTMDGVATERGFLPTELNPRFGGALGRMARSMPALPLYLLHVATMAGRELDYRPKTFEALVRQQAGRHPVVRAMHVLEGRSDLEARDQSICRSGDGWRLAEEDEDSDVVLTLGPSSSGSVLFASFRESSIRRGPSSASEVCEVFAFADALWGLNLGRLDPARESKPHKD